MSIRSRLRSVYNRVAIWWRERSLTDQQRMDRLLDGGQTPAPPAAPGRNNPPERPRLSLKATFDNAVRHVQDGTIRLGFTEQFQFGLAVRLANLFNMLNFGGITESLVEHFQKSAVETVRQNGRRDIPLVPFM